MESKSEGDGNNRNLAAGHTHVPADTRPIVAAVDNEIVPLRLEPDRAVYCGCEK